MKIAVTGASGFIGKHVLRTLVNNDYEVNALFHGRIPDGFANDKIKWFRSDIHNPDTFTDRLVGVDVVLHLIGIIAETKTLTFVKTVVEGTNNLVDACRKNSVKKIIYISALGTAENAVSRYHASKWKAEEAIRNSGMEWIILRPSVVFGPGDSFVNTLAKTIRKLPFAPVIGDGRYELQPVAVGDLAYAITGSITNSNAIGKTFEIGGPESMEFRRILSIIKKVLNIKRKNIYFPLMLMKIVAGVLEMIFKPAPLTKDQLLMLEAGSTCDNKPVIDTFNMSLTGFEDGIKKYLR